MVLTRIKARIDVSSARYKWCLLTIVCSVWVLFVQPASAITFNLINNDGVGEGFNDPTLGADRLAAFDFALDIWSDLLQERFVGETINVSAEMNPLGGSATAAILGAAGTPLIHRNFAGPAAPYMASTWYGSALGNHLNHGDLNGGNPEIVAQFNSDVDGGVVLGANTWYYGTDASPPGGDIDFATVVLHEVGHGLNFFDLIDTPTGDPPIGGTGAFPGTPADPGIYDRFLMEGSPAGTAFTAMTDAERLLAVTSDDVYWLGANGIAGNGGTAPKIHAPMMFQPGSSISHLDEIMHGAQLMSPSYSGPDHVPSSIEIGMLRDMGWSVVPEPTSFLLITLGFLTLVSGNRRRIDLA